MRTGTWGLGSGLPLPSSCSAETESCLIASWLGYEAGGFVELALWPLGCVLKLAALQSKLLSSESHLLASGLCFKAGPDPTVCGLGTGAWGLGSLVLGLGFGIWGLGSLVLGSGVRGLPSGRVWGLGLVSGVWSLGSKIWGLGSGVVSRFGVWCQGPGVWGRVFGSGVWGQGLGFWVSGLGS